MSRIVITGADGQLGQELRFLSGAVSAHQFLFLSRADLDITDAGQVTRFFAAQHADVLLNTAAYTAVDQAETDADNAYRVNAEAPALLAKAARDRSMRLLHISTDFVFDGSLSRPLTEDDAPHPVGVYGASKREGELRIMAANSDALILRTAWVYSSFGKNFVKTILRLCREKDSLRIICDQVGSPTYARDLAQALLHIAVAEKWHPGLYHYSNEGVASWYDFALAIRDGAGLKTPIYPIETKDYPTPAMRPSYSVLNKRKIKTTFGIEIPYWRYSLKKCMALLAEQKI